ncbi:hypothetical protein AB7C87_13435 [Natrarchaeobius sp. A-rgal3]|uniref:hypothetical protein n=1 Tax=Natrarchaeobius versutus TaxID=1679078 RepID=UPI00351025EA
MTERCPYCGEPVPEAAYDRHIERVHRDELGRIDRRRLGVDTASSRGVDTASSRGADDTANGRTVLLYAGVVAVLVALALGYGLVVLGTDETPSSAAVEPDTSAPTHEHGTIHVEYDGTVVDFDDPNYLERDGCFHFHAYDNADVWHVHCEDVTVEYALETLGMELSEDRFAVGDETFSTDSGDEISVTVDGEPVDPTEHVLEGVESVDDARDGAGDDLEVVVESGG